MTFEPSSPRSAILSLALLAVISLEACGSRPGEDPTRDCRGCNVLLLAFDALRADHLGLYGYEKATSPGLDPSRGRRLSSMTLSLNPEVQ